MSSNSCHVPCLRPSRRRLPFTGSQQTLAPRAPRPASFQPLTGTLGYPFLPLHLEGGGVVHLATEPLPVTPVLPFAAAAFGLIFDPDTADLAEELRSARGFTPGAGNEDNNTVISATFARELGSAKHSLPRAREGNKSDIDVASLRGPREHPRSTDTEDR